MSGGCESRPTRVVADWSEPSLAGVVVTRGPKRRQGSYGVRKDSPERLNVVEAETVPVVEGHVYAVVTQDGDAPPGSRIASRTKGRRRDPGRPTGSVRLVFDGRLTRRRTGETSRAGGG